MTRAPSLALRLALAFSVAFVSVAVLVGGLQAVLAERFGAQVTRMSMEGQTEDLFDGIVFGPDQTVLRIELEPGDAVGFDDFFANLKFRLLDERGEVVASSEADRRSLLPALAVAEQAGYFGTVPYDGTAFYVGAWQRELGGKTYTLQLGRSDRFEALAREALAPAITDTIVLLGGLAVLIFGVASTLAVRSVLRPIREVIASAQQVGGQNLAARLPSARLPAEIQPLVAAFNGVLDRLELAFLQQERFVANAAHELKTPLALVRARIETGMPEAADRALTLSEIDAMGRHVHQLLQLAEIADTQGLRRAPVALGEVAGRVLAQLSWKAQKHDVVLHLLDTDAAVVLDADAGAVLALVRNLVENAIDFSPAGGVVRLQLHPQGLVVDDEGPGIPAELRDQVFERFWRAPGQQRAGSGLGLAIVREVARAHGWQVGCAASPAGGARFELRWPLRPSAPHPPETPRR